MILRESKLFFQPWDEVKPYALPIRSICGVEFKGTPDDAFTWNEWDDCIKERWPVRFYIYEEIIPTIQGKWNYYVTENIWKFKHRFIPKHKYHIVDTGLPPGYHDPSESMLYAWMNMLKRFMEIGAPQVEWDATKPHAEAFEKMKKAYNWWLNYDNRLEKIRKALDDDDQVEITNEDGTKGKMFKSFILEEELEKEADEMLKLIIDVRGFLWYP